MSTQTKVEHVSLWDALLDLKKLRDEILAIHIVAVHRDRERPITCGGVGCIGCCHQLISAYVFEGAIIALQLLEQHAAETIRRICTQGRLQYDLLGRKPLGFDLPKYEAATNEWMNSCTACALLDAKLSCKVYDVRPIVCSSYFVSSPVAQCDPPSGKDVMVADMTWPITQVQDLDKQFLSDLLGTPLPGAVALPLGVAISFGSVLVTEGVDAFREVFPLRMQPT